MTAAEYVPERPSLPTLRKAVQGCRGCPLYANATRAVFGEGATHAELILVGEQPGDKEDLAGRPFVGPAGRLLDEALAEAGIDRSRAYVTNAVKHFKWQGRASGGSTRSRPGRSRSPAGPGWRRNWPPSGPEWSSRSGRPRRSRFSAGTSA